MPSIPSLPRPKHPLSNTAAVAPQRSNSISPDFVQSALRPKRMCCELHTWPQRKSVFSLNALHPNKNQSCLLKHSSLLAASNLAKTLIPFQAITCGSISLGGGITVTLGAFPASPVVIAKWFASIAVNLASSAAANPGICAVPPTQRMLLDILRKRSSPAGPT